MCFGGRGASGAGCAVVRRSDTQYLGDLYTGGEDTNLRFFFSNQKVPTGGLMLQTILSTFPIYVLFRSLNLAEITFSCLALFDQGHPAGRRLQIASTVERQRSH